IPTAASAPSGITAGSDGALWFTERDKIGRISTAGIVTETPLPSSGLLPLQITQGPDGNLWFTDANDSSVGTITLARAVTIIAVPNPGYPYSEGIVAGPDGALWFTEFLGTRVGRV